MKILGVDLGSYSIKVAELDASSKSFVINNFFEMPLSVDPSRDRGLQIIEALRTLAANYDPTTTRWVVGVPQHRVSVHQKRFPFKERAKILKSLAFELEDEIPLDIDETIFDYKIIEFIGSSADILTVACPKEAIEEVLNVAKDGGFDPEIVSVEGLALSNIFENWNQPPPDVSPSLRNPDQSSSLVQQPSMRSRLILHVGHQRSLLLVYREGGLVATRSIVWGGSEIADAIVRSFNVPIFEAMKMLTTRSFILMNSAGATAEQLKISKTISAQVDNLLRDLKLTLLEIKSAFNLDFEQIELIGGTSQIQNLGAYITQGLEIPTNINQNVLAAHPSRIQLTQPLEAVSAVAVGLAIEGMKRSRNPAINLRKDAFARENVALKRFWQTWRVPAQVALSAFVIFFVYSLIRDQVASSLILTADEKLTEAAQKAANLKGSAGSESAIRAFIRGERDKVKTRESLAQLDDYVSAMDVLAKISEKAPGKVPPPRGIDVTFFEIENDDLTIRGRAGAEQIPLIEKMLNELSRDKKVIKNVGGGNFDYKLKINRKL